MISASTMPPSLRSTVIDSLAQVAWSGSGCGSTSQRLGFLVGTRAPIGSDSMEARRCVRGGPGYLRIGYAALVASIVEKQARYL
jgi:hypothetical protein